MITAVIFTERYKIQSTDVGMLRIQSGQKLSDGGDLEEPVEACLLGRVVHIFNCERVWRTGQIKAEVTQKHTEFYNLEHISSSNEIGLDPGRTTLIPHLAEVLGRNTWSRFYRKPAGLPTNETAVRKPIVFFCLSLN